MTRQKKEIIKKIDEIQAFIEVDRELGCGFAPVGAYEELEQQIDVLCQELAHLQHYKDVMEMVNDSRGCNPVADSDLPFH